MSRNWVGAKRRVVYVVDSRKDAQMWSVPRFGSTEHVRTDAGTSGGTTTINECESDNRGWAEKWMEREAAGMSDIVGPAIDVRGPFTETWVNPARWKHRMVEAMCDRYPEEPAVIDQRLIALRDSMYGGPQLAGSVVDVVTVSAGDNHEPEPARGDWENRGGTRQNVQPAADVGQAESQT